MLEVVKRMDHDDKTESAEGEGGEAGEEITCVEALPPEKIGSLEFWRWIM